MEQAHRRLVGDIVEGRLAPGQQLLETALAKELGVSRTPVREALLLLVHEGLAVSTPSGLMVTQLTMRDVQDLMQTAQVLNGLACRLAARRGTEQQMQKLEELMVRLERAADQDDIPGWIPTDRQLHKQIQVMADNRSLLRFASQLDAILARIRPLAIKQPGRLHHSMLEHRLVVDAIRMRDADSAERAMRAHLASTESILMGILENFVVPFKGEYF